MDSAIFPPDILHALISHFWARNPLARSCRALYAYASTIDPAIYARIYKVEGADSVTYKSAFPNGICHGDTFTLHFAGGEEFVRTYELGKLLGGSTRLGDIKTTLVNLSLETVISWDENGDMPVSKFNIRSALFPESIIYYPDSGISTTIRQGSRCGEIYRRTPPPTDLTPKGLIAWYRSSPFWLSEQETVLHAKTTACACRIL